MLTRQEVVESYLELAELRQAAAGVLKQDIRHLPPALCRFLALQDNADHLEHQYTAVDDSQLHSLSVGNESIAVYLSERALPVMGELPLQGHQVTSNAILQLNTIESGLETLRSLGQSKSQFVAEWTSMIVWVERATTFSGQLLTSSTFPNYPHCTFLSLKSLQHIPPNNVLGFPSSYALAENLYHEALHQQLAAWLLHKAVLRESYLSDQSEKIPVPWRGGAWEPDRVFHAIYVYSHLIPLRKVAMETLSLRPSEKIWLSQALNEGREALAYLTGEMEKRMTIFRTDTVEEAYSILTDARSVLDEIH